MEEKAQGGAEEPREVVWPFLFTPSISAAPDLSGGAAHSLSCSLKAAGRSFQDRFCNHLQNQPTWRQKNNTPIAQKGNLIIIVLYCSPNTPDDRKQEGGMCCKYHRNRFTWTRTLGILALLLSQRRCSWSTSPQQHEVRPYCAESAIYSGPGCKNKHISESNDVIPARAAPNIFMLWSKRDKT